MTTDPLALSTWKDLEALCEAHVVRCQQVQGLVNVLLAGEALSATDRTKVAGWRDTAAAGEQNARELATKLRAAILDGAAPSPHIH